MYSPEYFVWSPVVAVLLSAPHQPECNAFFHIALLYPCLGEDSAYAALQMQHEHWHMRLL